MKKIICIIILFQFLITSCKQESNDVLIDNPKTICDFVHNKNETLKMMIILMDGENFDTFIKNKNTKEYKEWFKCFEYFSVILPEAEKNMNFKDSSYMSCSEWKEMSENLKKVFDKHVSD